MKNVPALLLACLSSSLLGSCSTVATWNEGCPGIYSGYRFNEEQRADLAPLDEELDPQWVLLFIDLPFSVVLDTLTLPITFIARSYAEPRPSGAPGCNWCAEQAAARKAEQAGATGEPGDGEAGGSTGAH